MSSTEITVAIAIFSAVANLLMLAIGGTWKLSRVETSIKDEIHNQRSELDNDIEDVRRYAGEAVAALRQKVTEVEFYVRDNYVKKESFNEATARLATELRSFGDKLEERLNHFGTKLDNLKERSDRRDARELASAQIDH